MPRRSYGTGQLYEKHGAWYGRWRTNDGRRLNRRVGEIRSPGESDGMTRAMAEREFRRIQQAEERSPRAARPRERRTVKEASDSLRRTLAVGGARPTYLSCCESMQRVHVDPPSVIFAWRRQRAAMSRTSRLRCSTRAWHRRRCATS
jgi:hypothetical protein